METVEVDGSYGEGGGQTLRTAVAFSVIQRRPIHVTKIRAGREAPGLRQQHASTLKILSDVFDAELHGAEVGSSEISFSPGRPRVSSMTVDMKTAASITLLLQAVIPAVSLARTRLTLDLTGGTDVPWSPTFDYFSTVVAEAYRRLGIPFRVTASRRGYYPNGGGRVRAEVDASEGITPVDFTTTERQARVDLVSRCARLPRNVAERQMNSMERVLASSGIEVRSEELREEPADSPGSSVMASVTNGGRILGADAIGARGKRAEDVGKEAAAKLASTLKSGAPVDSNLADMIAPLLSLAGGTSTVLVPEVSLHLKTGLYLAKLLTGCDYSWKEQGAGFMVTIRPVSGHNA